MFRSSRYSSYTLPDNLYVHIYTMYREGTICPIVVWRLVYIVHILTFNNHFSDYSLEYLHVEKILYHFLGEGRSIEVQSIISLSGYTTFMTWEFRDKPFILIFKMLILVYNPLCLGFRDWLDFSIRLTHFIMIYLLGSIHIIVFTISRSRNGHGSVTVTSYSHTTSTLWSWTGKNSK